MLILRIRRVDLVRGSNSCELKTFIEPAVAAHVYALRTRVVDEVGCAFSAVSNHNANICFTFVFMWISELTRDEVIANSTKRAEVRNFGRTIEHLLVRCHISDVLVGFAVEQVAGRHN